MGLDLEFSTVTSPGEKLRVEQKKREGAGGAVLRFSLLNTKIFPRAKYRPVLERREFKWKV